MKQHSHLFTIIQRVKRIIRVNKEGTSQQKLHAVLPYAFNLVEYLSYNDDFTNDEGHEAGRLLTMLGLPMKVDEDHGLGYNEVASKLLAEGKIPDIPSRHCRRCGRALSNEVSIQHGLGPICRSKQAREDAVATRDIDREGTLEGIDALAKELEGEAEPTKKKVKTIDDSKQLTLF